MSKAARYRALNDACQSALGELTAVRAAGTPRPTSSGVETVETREEQAPTVPPTQQRPSLTGTEQSTTSKELLALTREVLDAEDQGSVKKLQELCFGDATCVLPTGHVVDALPYWAFHAINAKDAGVQFRPHVKTHRTLEGALLQCGGQPGPIVVSTLAEAEFYADTGFTDMIYGVPIAASKLARVHTLLQRGVGVHVFVDHPAQLDAIEKYANENGHPVFGVYLKVDCGYHRAGVPLTDDSLAFAKRLATSKAVHLHGIYTHSGHAYGCTADKLKAVALSEQEAASKFAAALRANGVSVGVVSVGSTPACATAASFGGVTEIHPGNYILYDCQQVSFGACDLDDCAGVVLSTIISHYPDRSRAIIDAGAFALSKDTCLNGEFGHIIGHPDLKIVAISQEEGIVEYAGSGDPQEHLFKALPIGSVVKVVPNHSCLAAANHLETVVIDEEDRIVGRWKRCLGWRCRKRRSKKTAEVIA